MIGTKHLSFETTAIFRFGTDRGTLELTVGSGIEIGIGNSRGAVADSNLARIPFVVHFLYRFTLATVEAVAVSAFYSIVVLVGAFGNIFGVFCEFAAETGPSSGAIASL